MSDALELMVFCNHDGQIDQKSDFETRLYDELCNSITKNVQDRKHLCLIWMFLRSWGPSGMDKIQSCQEFSILLRRFLTESFYR